MSVTMTGKEKILLMCFIFTFPVVVNSQHDKLEHFSSTMIKPSDIVFLIDSSTGIQDSGFEDQKQFVENVLTHAKVSQNSTRISVIVYGKSASIPINFMKNPQNKCAFIDKLHALKYQDLGKMVMKKPTSLALNLFQNSARKDVNKILVIMVLSKYRPRHEPPCPSEILAKKHGVSIYAFGVGPTPSKLRAKLLGLAFSPDRIFVVNSRTELMQIGDFIKADPKENQLEVEESCSSVCGASLDPNDCCDTQAECTCGLLSGRRQCTCKPGFFGITGLQGNCKPCPKGTYKDVLAPTIGCTPCPENASTAREGSTGIKDCSCLETFSGNPAKGIPCSRITCPTLPNPENGRVEQPEKNVIGSIATYSCNEGHRLVGNAGQNQRECTINGWTGNEPSCEAIRCPVLEKPLNGRFKENCDTAIDTRCEVICDDGFQVRQPENAVRICGREGTWSGQQAECERPVIRMCPTLQKPENGRIVGTCKNTTFSLCEFECDLGHILVGSASRFCAGDLTWTGEETICRKVECPNLEMREGVELEGECQATFGEECRFTCSKGFEMHPESHSVLTCLPNGQWSGDLPVCHPILCPALVPLEFPIIHGPCDNKMGSTCTLKCFNGWEFQDGTTELERTCLETKKWSNEEAICQKIRCPELLPPENGKFVEDCNNIFGSVCKYECSSGYSISSGTSSWRYCQANKTWTGKPVTCDPEECIELRPREHGKFQCNDEEMKTGTVCSLICEPGFDLTERNEMECLGKTGWTNDLLDCKAVSCPPLPKIKNGAFDNCGHNERHVFEDSCIFRCDEGFKVNGSLILSCSANGTWVDSCGRSYLPTCVQICPAGTFKKEDSSCNLCPVGTFQNDTDALSCRSCPPTTTTSGEGSNDLSQCLVPCPAGTFSDTGLVPCEECDFNEYQNLPKQQQCKKCPTFSETTSKGAVSLEECQEMCKPGEFSENGFAPCQQCPLNHYQDSPKAKKCNSCPLNTKTASGGATSEEDCRDPCPPGTFSSDGLSPCYQCEYDEYQDMEEQTRCKLCPKGTITTTKGAESAKECKVPCQPGHYSEDGIAPCLPCDFDTYQEDFAEVGCRPCPEGRGTAEKGSTSIDMCKVICPKGSYSSTGLEPCIKCEKDTYQDETGAFECKFCPDDFVTLTDGAQSEDDCKEICNIGTYFQSGDEPCIECPVDHYQDQLNQTSCKRCPNDQVTLEEGSTSLEDCKELCPPGEISDTGVLPCLRCPLNEYKEKKGGFECIACPEGRITLFEGAASSNDCKEPCGAGRFSANGVEPCQPCPKNQYQNATFQTICIPCPDGKVTSSEGATSVNDCQGGEIDPKKDDTPDGKNRITINGTLTLVVTFTDAIIVDRKFPSHDEVTVSLWVQTNDTDHAGALVSYAANGRIDNALTITDYNNVKISVNNEEVPTGVKLNDGNWHHFAFTWSAKNGTYGVFHNCNKVKQGEGLQTGNTIPGGGILTLGQEQDIVGGGFNPLEMFVGNMTGVNFWRRALSDREIGKLCALQEATIPGKTKTWTELTNSTTGQFTIHVNQMVVTNLKDVPPEVRVKYIVNGQNGHVPSNSP